MRKSLIDLLGKYAGESINPTGLPFTTLLDWQVFPKLDRENCLLPMGCIYGGKETIDSKGSKDGRTRVMFFRGQF